jgi:chromosomal replication initiator protein
MAGQSRTKQIALARQTAMYLMRTRLNLSLNEVGFHFGDRDHTTVMHAVGRVTKLRAQDPAFATRLDKLTKGIGRGEAG